MIGGSIWSSIGGSFLFIPLSVSIVVVTKKKIKSKNQKDDIPIVLVGTQSDLRNDAQTLVELAQYKETPVSEADARKLVQSMGFDDYIESSSLTQKNLKEVFDEAILVVMCPPKGYKPKKFKKPK